MNTQQVFQELIDESFDILLNRERMSRKEFDRRAKRLLEAWSELHDLEFKNNNNTRERL